MKIEWKTVPKYIINISDLNMAYEICHRFRSWNIKHYVYMIKYHGLVIKYGHSVDEKSEPGNRLYRQIGHCEVWDNDPFYKKINGDSGSEWRIIEDRFHRLYGTKMMKDRMTVEVYDFTNYKFKSIKPIDEVKYAEQFLISTYNNITGDNPIGNIQHDKNYDRKAHVAADTFHQNFDFN